MYKVTWDHAINGIVLDDKIQERAALAIPPRPVFHEELDLLGFQEYWQYQPSEYPLLWASGRTYYHNGEPVAEAQGGNLYERPHLVVHQQPRFEPINIPLILERNREALSICEDDAKDFVQSVYKKYRGKVDYFAVAFSGGKDSQVTLDIVSQMLAPDEYIVIFTDTTMEIPFTYETVEETKDFYHNLYPRLKFYTAHPPQVSSELWEIFGPPSRLHRWCCSVCKTAPFARRIKELQKENGKSGTPKILVFEGVRSDESVQRSRYQRLVKGLKHLNQRNGRVIFDWNTSEIFLYLFYKGIKLNQAYRYGLHRVGCSLCPFSRGWSDYILNFLFPNISNTFINIIKQSTLINSGITDEDKVKQYLIEEQWKKRGGGKYLEISDGTRVDLVQKENTLKFILRNPRENFLEWLNVIGEFWYKHEGQYTRGEIKSNEKVISFEIEHADDNIEIINIHGIKDDIITCGQLKKIIYKTTFCVHCGACEVECPTEALQVIPKVKIEKKLCIHCANCLNFDDKGCLVAKSRTESLGERNMELKKKANPDRYSGFGIRKEWLDSYFNNPDTWIESFLRKDKENPLALGPKQVPALRAWLKEANLIDENNAPTKLSRILNEIRLKNYSVLWQLLWVNFSYNSPIVGWYTNVKMGKYTKKELNELVKTDFPEHGERTLSNSIDALVSMFDHSPFGSSLKMGILTKKGKVVTSIEKQGSSQIHPITIAYCLYRYAEDKQHYDLLVSDFYEEQCDKGPYKLFGFPKELFEDTLRFLQEEKNQTVRVDLQADLENIFLREDITSNDILGMIRIENEQ